MIRRLAALTGLAIAVRPELYGAIVKSARAAVMAYCIALGTFSPSKDEPVSTVVILTA